MNNENNKPNNLGQGKIIFVIVAIAVIILLCIGGYLLGYKKGSNNTDLDNNDINNTNKTIFFISISSPSSLEH